MGNESGYQAIIIHLGGRFEKTHIPGGKELATLQATVGGYIEAVYGWTGDPETTDADVTFFINDSGAIDGLPVNVAATSFWWIHDKRIGWTGLPPWRGCGDRWR